MSVPRAPRHGVEPCGLLACLVHAPAAERSAARGRLLLVVPDMTTRRAAAVGTHVARERQTDVRATARWAHVADFHRPELCKRLSHPVIQAPLQRDSPTDSRSRPSTCALLAEFVTGSISAPRAPPPALTRERLPPRDTPRRPSSRSDWSARCAMPTGPQDSGAAPLVQPPRARQKPGWQVRNTAGRAPPPRALLLIHRSGFFAGSGPKGGC
jgi:hypothetical protein